MIAVVIALAALLILWKSLYYGMEGVTSLLKKRKVNAATGVVLVLPISIAASLAFRSGVPALMVPMLCGFSIGSLLLGTGLAGLFSSGGEAPAGKDWLLLASLLPLLVVLVDARGLEGIIPMLLGLSFLHQREREGVPFEKRKGSYGKWQAVSVVLVALLGLLVSANVLLEQTVAIAEGYSVPRGTVSMLVGGGVALAVMGGKLKEAVDGDASAAFQRGLDSAALANTLGLGAIALTAPIGLSFFDLSASFVAASSTVLFALVSEKGVSKELGFALAASYPLLLLAVNDAAELLWMLS